MVSLKEQAENIKLHGEVVYENFNGLEHTFNRQGDRNFCLYLSDDQATWLERFNVVLRCNDDDPRRFTRIKLGSKLPQLWVANGIQVTVEVTVYDWKTTYHEGSTLYLKTLTVN